MILEVARRAVARAFSVKVLVVMKTPFLARRTWRAPMEVAELRFADGVFPALGLDVDGVEAEGVLIDDAIDATVAGDGGEMSCGIFKERCRMKGFRFRSSGFRWGR